MGLDDITPEEVATGEETSSPGSSLEVGEVKSKKKIENLTMSENWWEWYVAGHNPHILSADLSDKTDEELKAILQLLDRAIMNNIPGLEVSDDVTSEAKQTREKIVEELEDRGYGT